MHQLWIVLKKEKRIYTHVKMKRTINRRNRVLQLGRSLLNAISAQRTLAVTVVFASTEEDIQVKRLICVKNVERPLVKQEL